MSMDNEAGQVNIKDIHWLMDMLQSIDVGLIVLDSDYRVMVWNSFMENHSGVSPAIIKDKILFDIFPSIPQKWFRRKAESVFLLQSSTFTVWEQRPYLFQFKNYRPITGAADYMYQNITILPLSSADNEVRQIGVLIYDVTDIAVNKLKLEKANNKLAQLSKTDHLTQLNNRGAWEGYLEREYNRSKRSRHNCSVVMFDIDHFKKVNDTYGHQAGDEVIRRTAALLKDTMRNTDIAGRYGGEEFGVILVDTTAKDALVFTERLRQRIEAEVVEYDEFKIKYTISLGVSELAESCESYQSWLEQSDKALYVCKESGRNQSCVYSDD
ncbi:diguanylate cyclase (GGDEF domain) with PAS/PAC sensor [hydrothermal vent metagenome]|uniref:Diguanylate cyclase (GGDEF domain) with PAS/PAC sensor n=1 Tax=hydrothermal vent metagenome TaxID=652676 RepID=A0A3B0YPF0_9ZZZZ